MRHRIIAPLAAAVLLLGGAAACSDDDGDDQSAGETVDSLVDEGEEAASTASSAIDEGATDAAETAARNLAAEHGEDAFEEAGHPLEDGLECEATATDGNDAIDVSCTGTTEDGAEAELTGTTSELPGASATELEGDFTGTVDGDEAFTTTALGDEGT